MEIHHRTRAEFLRSARGVSPGLTRASERRRSVGRQPKAAAKRRRSSLGIAGGEVVGMMQRRSRPATRKHDAAPEACPALGGREWANSSSSENAYKPGVSAPPQARGSILLRTAPARPVPRSALEGNRRCRPDPPAMPLPKVSQNCPRPQLNPSGWIVAGSA